MFKNSLILSKIKTVKVLTLLVLHTNLRLNKSRKGTERYLQLFRHWFKSLIQVIT